MAREIGDNLGVVLRHEPGPRKEDHQLTVCCLLRGADDVLVGAIPLLLVGGRLGAGALAKPLHRWVGAVALSGTQPVESAMPPPAPLRGSRAAAAAVRPALIRSSGSRCAGIVALILSITIKPAPQIEPQPSTSEQKLGSIHTSGCDPGLGDPGHPAGQRPTHPAPSTPSIGGTAAAAAPRSRWLCAAMLHLQGAALATHQHATHAHPALIWLMHGPATRCGPALATHSLHGSRIGRHQPCSRRTECCSPRTAARTESICVLPCSSCGALPLPRSCCAAESAWVVCRAAVAPPRRGLLDK